ncbi:MAG: ribonucleotide reductase N-terminal alpha domain-containing protein [Anaerolineales bacterium]|nr:ribonucleotide reductase N-terminal alpha domain-containing protein [Anaerolineales bacterium]
MNTTAAPSLSPTEPVNMELSENARRVLTRRYLRRGSDGQAIETIEEMVHRVAILTLIAISASTEMRAVARRWNIIEKPTGLA